MDRKVKGSVVTDMVKVVRAFKDQPWDDYLTPEDWEIVNSMIIPTGWYPIECYQRIGYAVYKLVAKENEEAVRQFGLAAMREMLTGPYKPFLAKGDPFEAAQKFFDLRRSLFNFSKMGAKRTGDNSLRVEISEFGDFEFGPEVFMTLLKAHLEELITQNGGKDVKMEGLAKGGEMILDVSWT